MRIDLHVHTDRSDGLLSPRDVVKTARKNGMNGVAICDHNTIKGYKDACSYSRHEKDFVVIPGIEVSTTEGHVLGLGVRSKVKRDLEPSEAIERLRDQGAVVIIPHAGKVPSGVPFKVIEGLEFDGMETYNGRAIKCFNQKADELCDSRKKAKVGGSDGHTANQIGRAFTIFKTSSLDPEDLYQEIRKRKTKGMGRDIGLGEFMSDSVRIFKKYAGRGFRKI